MVESNPTHDAREVIALPVDPASIAAISHPVRGDSRAGADRAARREAIEDSAATVDRAFQAERESLNREALALDSVDRRTSEYGRRFDEFRHRTQVADSARRQRDRLRLRVATQWRLADSAMGSPVSSPSRRASIEAATDGSRRALVVLTRSDTARLAITNGDWWLGVSALGGVPEQWLRVAVPHTDVVLLPR